MKQRGFSTILILVGVLIMVAVAGGAYYFGRQTVSKPQPQNSPAVSTSQATSQLSSVSSPSPSDETANWKTYTSKKYGFSIKYPPNLVADYETAAPPSVLFQPTPQTGLPGFPHLFVSVMSDPPNPNDLGYDRFTAGELADLYSANVGDTVPLEAGKTLKPPYSDYWNFKRLPDVTVDGILGQVFENSKVWEGGNNLKDRRVLIKKNNSIYMIGTYYQTTDELNTFSSFLSTLKLP